MSIKKVKASVDVKSKVDAEFGVNSKTSAGSDIKRKIVSDVDVKGKIPADVIIGRDFSKKHKDAKLEPLTVTENGVYEPDSNVDGYNKVTVDVPERAIVLSNIEVMSNGLYTPPEGVDGYGSVDVKVPSRAPTQSLYVMANGTYNPEPGQSGYKSVIVAVPQRVPEIEPLTVTEDGTYTASGDGYNPITVSTGVDTLREEINNALNALGKNQLVNGINELIAEINVKTGATDLTLSDAIARLIT